MAPTICMSEHVVTRQEKASPYFCRRRLQFKRDLGQEPNVVSRRSRSLLLQNNSPWRQKCPPDSSSVSYFKEQSNACKDQLARREGLLNIIVRTISLMRRNHILQKRVDALRSETQEFINSVISNSSSSNSKTLESSKVENSGSVSLVTSTTKEPLSDTESTSNTDSHPSKPTNATAFSDSNAREHHF